MLKAICSKKNLKEHLYFKAVEDIIYSDEIQQLKNFQHHLSTTRFQHSLNVSYYNYLFCKKFNFNARAAARAGLLHDLFFYNRKEYIRKTGEKRHIGRHPQIALQNASSRFEINHIEKDIILKHMWPFTLALPKYKETYVIILIDKYCAIIEFFAPYLSMFKRKKNKVKKLEMNKIKTATLVE